MKIETKDKLLSQAMVDYIRRFIRLGEMVEVRYLGGDDSLSATIDQELMKKTRAFVIGIIGGHKDFSVIAVFEACVDSAQKKACCHPFKCSVRASAKCFETVKVHD